MNSQEENVIRNAANTTNIEADILATAMVAASSTQNTGTESSATQMGGQASGSQQDYGNPVDPWQNQTLPQRTFEQATVSPDVAWQGYRPGVAAGIQVEGNTPTQQQPYYQSAFDAKWEYVPPRGQPIPVQPVIPAQNAQTAPGILTN